MTEPLETIQPSYRSPDGEPLYAAGDIARAADSTYRYHVSQLFKALKTTLAYRGETKCPCCGHDPKPEVGNG